MAVDAVLVAAGADELLAAPPEDDDSDDPLFDFADAVLSLEPLLDPPLSLELLADEPPSPDELLLAVLFEP